MIRDGSLPDEVYIILGNGFDIECGLPTSYKDFLQFLLVVKNMTEEGVPEDKQDTLKAEIKERLLKSSYSEWSSVLDTFWFKHFQLASKSIRGGWLDFENEIQRVIYVIESSMRLPQINNDRFLLSGDDPVTLPKTTGFRPTELQRIVEMTGAKISFGYKVINGIEYQESSITYRQLAERLSNDLDAFIKALEVYLRDYVSLIEPRITSNVELLFHHIEHSRIKRVLSFNYTDTFEKMLKAKNVQAVYCYVHGRIGKDTKNRMVLGIPEDRTDNEIRDYIIFAPFRKYNQRIFKETDSNYMDWISNMQVNARRHLYVFGHALGTPDQDILKPLITGNGIDTTIYYRKPSTFSKQVGNLTVIIGKDEMIMRNGGNDRTMEFVPQQ